MKNPFYPLVICSLLLSAQAMAQDDSTYKQKLQHQKDSIREAINREEGRDKLLSYNKLASLYYMDGMDELKMDTLLTLYTEMDAEAQKQEDYNFCAVARGNILGVYLNARMYDRLIEVAPEHLRFIKEHKAWKHYFNVYSRYIMTFMLRGNYEEGITHAGILYREAEELENKSGMATALYAMATVYQRQRRYEEVERCCRQCITLATGDEHSSRILVDAYHLLCKTLINSKRYDELLEVAAGYEKANQGYDAYAKMTVISDWANLWMIYAKYYCYTGDFDKAEEYCQKIEDVVSASAYKIDIYRIRAHIYNSRGEYAQALEMIEKVSEQRAGTTEFAELYDINVLKIDVLARMHQAEEITVLYQEALALNDSLRNIDYARQIDEIHTQYEVNRHIEEKERNRNYALLATIGFALAIVALVIWIVYSRRLQEKNRSLVRRLREQDALALRLEQLQAIQPDDLGTALPTDPLYQRLIALLNDEVYTDSELTRATLVARLNTNDRYLSDLIKQHFSQTVSDLITTYRLRHARQLLADPHCTLTIEAIALDSGFGTRTTFHILFRKHYGLSPAEFRRLSLQENE